MNNYIYRLLKIIPVSLSMLFLCIACEKETAVLLPKNEDLVPVTFSMDMAPGTFETSTDIEPMHAKSDPVPYTVLRFSTRSYLIILKQVEGGWVIDKLMNNAIPVGYELKNNNLFIPSIECELRPGVYRFVLLANCRNLDLGLKENLFVKDPSMVTAINYDPFVSGTKAPLCDELFIAKTEDITVHRNANLNQIPNRLFSLKMERVVAMMRFAVAMEIPFFDLHRMSYSINLGQSLYTVNLFGDLVKADKAETLYGFYDVVQNNAYPIDINGVKNFYFADMTANATSSNNARFILLPKSELEALANVVFDNIIGGESINPITCNFSLKLNTINGVVIYEGENKNFSWYKVGGESYPVNYFPSIPNSDYIELNNGIR